MGGEALGDRLNFHHQFVARAIGFLNRCTAQAFSLYQNAAAQGKVDWGKAYEGVNDQSHVSLGFIDSLPIFKHSSAKTREYRTPLGRWLQHDSFKVPMIEACEKWLESLSEYKEDLRARLGIPNFSTPHFRGTHLLAFQTIFNTSSLPLYHLPVSFSYDVTFAVTMNCLDVSRGKLPKEVAPTHSVDGHEEPSKVWDIFEKTLLSIGSDGSSEPLWDAQKSSLADELGPHWTKIKVKGTVAVGSYRGEIVLPWKASYHKGNKKISVRAFQPVTSIRPEKTKNGLPFMKTLRVGNDSVEELQNIIKQQCGVPEEEGFNPDLLESSKLKFGGIDLGGRFKIAAAFIKTDEDDDRVQGFGLYTAQKAQDILRGHQRKMARTPFIVDLKQLKAAAVDDDRLSMADDYFRVLFQSSYAVRQGTYLHKKSQKAHLNAVVDDIIRQMGVTSDPDSPLFVMLIGNGVDSIGKGMSHTFDQRASIIRALKKRCKDLGLRVEFRLIGEDWTSQICPRPKCTMPRSETDATLIRST